MTENESIKILQGAIKKPNTRDGYLGQAVTMAIQVLEKVQQYEAIGTVEEFKMLKDDLWKLNEICKDYSAIGTVEEFKRAKEMESLYRQVKCERDVAISQLEEIGVGLGQKMDEFKALKEKSVAKKPIDKELYIECPSCGNIVTEDSYCQCGQYVK